MVVEPQPVKISAALLQKCEPLDLPVTGDMPDLIIIRLAGRFKECSDSKSALINAVKGMQ